MASKVKKYCKQCWSPNNVLRVVSRYTTRVFAAVVWCGVMWSLLGNDSYPLQYLNYLQSKQLQQCINSSLEVPSSDLDTLLQYLPADWNESIYSTEYSLVALSQDLGSSDSNVSYQLLLLRRDNECHNRLQLQNIVLEISYVINDSNETTIFTDVDRSISNVSLDLFNLLRSELEDRLLVNIRDGHFFALVLLLIFSSILGVLAKAVFLPPLFGMIIAGFILRNVPYVDFATHINTAWSSTIRNVALVIVLIRGGLSMDPKQLKRQKVAVVLLALLPCVLEGALDGVVGTFLLELPWQWAFMLGYIIAAISPAIVVPTTLKLQEAGYGTDKGIGTLIVAAASFDVVISISLFGVFFGLTFSAGNLILDIFRGPIQIVIGLLYGILFGLILWILPTKHFKKGSKTRNRFFLLFGLSLFALFGSRRAIFFGSSLAGSGALAVLILAFVAGQGWNKEEKKLVSRVFLIVWQLSEPLLFALIGAEVALEFITPSLVGLGIALILIGLVLRLITSFFAVLCNGFSWKYMLFVPIAWIPKATVQAAIGPLAFEFAMERGIDDKEVQLGRQVLTIAVLAIILTAPLGAIGVSLLGPVLLNKTAPSSSSDETPEEDPRAGTTREQSDVELAVQERSSTLKNEERNGIVCDQTDHDDINEPSFDQGQDTVADELHLDLYPAITENRETTV